MARATCTMPQLRTVFILAIIFIMCMFAFCTSNFLLILYHCTPPYLSTIRKEQFLSYAYAFFKILCSPVSASGNFRYPLIRVQSGYHFCIIRSKCVGFSGQWNIFCIKYFFFSMLNNFISLIFNYIPGFCIRRF